MVFRDNLVIISVWGCAEMLHQETFGALHASIISKLFVKIAVPNPIVQNFMMLDKSAL